MSANGGVAVYTYGWDTAFAIPVPDVNKAIVDHKSSPAGFSQTESGFTVTGNFGNWQICQGGDGKAVRMNLPLSDVALTYTSTGHSFTFNGNAIVEVELHYVPHNVPSPSGGNPRALVVNPTAPPSASQPVFSVIEMNLTPVTTVSSALVQTALTDWGTANLAEFAHVFSVVDLNLMVDQGQWGFVTPNYTSYAYLDGDSLEDSVFGVLTMTGDRTGDALAEQVSPTAIPPGSGAGFLISQTRTLLDLVRPAVMQAYPGLTNENFLLNDDSTKLYLTDDTSVALASVEQSGSTYYPYLTQLTIESDGQTLTLNSYTTTSVAAGITAACQSTHWYGIVLGTSNNGQTLKFVETQPAVIVHTIQQSPGSVLTQFIIAIVGLVALALLAALTGGAALIAGGLIIGLMLGADQIVPSVIQLVNKDDSPSIDLLLVNSVDPITWTDSSGFKLQYGSLNMSLQLGGDPLFV